MTIAEEIFNQFKDWDEAIIQSEMDCIDDFEKGCISQFKFKDNSILIFDDSDSKEIISVGNSNCNCGMHSTTECHLCYDPICANCTSESTYQEREWGFEADLCKRCGGH